MELNLKSPIRHRTKDQSGQLAIVLGVSLALMLGAAMLWKNFARVGMIQRIAQTVIAEEEAKELIFSKLKRLLISPLEGPQFDQMGNCGPFIRTQIAPLLEFKAADEFDLDSIPADIRYEPTVIAALNWTPDDTTESVFNCGDGDLNLQTKLRELGIQSASLELIRTRADRKSLSSKLNVRLQMRLPPSRDFSETRTYNYGISTLERFGLILISTDQAQSNFTINNSFVTVNATVLHGFAEAMGSTGFQLTPWLNHAGNLVFNERFYTNASSIQSNGQPNIKSLETLFSAGIESRFNFQKPLPLWNQNYGQGSGQINPLTVADVKNIWNNGFPHSPPATHTTFPCLANWKVPVHFSVPKPGNPLRHPADFLCANSVSLVNRSQKDFVAQPNSPIIISQTQIDQSCDTNSSGLSIGPMIVMAPDKDVTLNFINSSTFCGLIAAKSITVTANAEVELVGQFASEKFTFSGGKVTILDPRRGYSPALNNNYPKDFLEQTNGPANAFETPILNQPPKFFTGSLRIKCNKSEQPRFNASPEDIYLSALLPTGAAAYTLWDSTSGAETYGPIFAHGPKNYRASMMTNPLSLTEGDQKREVFFKIGRFIEDAP